MDEILTLEGALRFLVGTGSGILIFYLLERWTWYQNLQDYFAKRLIALVGPAPIAILAYLALIVFGYEAEPGSAKAWAEVLWSTGIGAIAAYLSYSIAEGRRRNGS